MAARMQNMETARCYQLQYDELELGRLHVTLPPKLFGIGQTWAPTPLPFREVKMVLALTQRCLSRIPARRPLVGPRQPLPTVC
jgi:hypothetical protein